MSATVEIIQPPEPVAPVEYNSAAELAAKMLEIIRERGWVRADVEDCDGKVCLVGALGLAHQMQPVDGYVLSGQAVSDVERGVSEYACIIDPYAPPGTLKLALWRFNDSYADDVEDVYAALRYVIDHPAEPVSV